MKKILITLLFALAFVAVPANAFTMDAQGGICNRVSHMGDFNMSFYGHLWYPIDRWSLLDLVSVMRNSTMLGTFLYLEAFGCASRLAARCCRSLQAISVICSARTIRCSGVLVAGSTSRMATAHRFSFRRVTSS